MIDQIIQQRRSARAFDSTPVKKEDITAMLEAARLAPSACNSQTWRFIVVTDREVIKKSRQKHFISLKPPVPYPSDILHP